MDLFADAGVEVLELPGADLRFFAQPDLGRSPGEWFACLRRELAWREESIRLYGKTYLQPRLLAWYGDPEATYRYSGKRYDPLPWAPVLRELKERIEAITGARYNSVTVATAWACMPMMNRSSARGR